MPYAPGEILLDKYRIEALLGQGAFGEVYRVAHLSLNVPRALKVLRRDAPGFGSTEYNECQARFQFEAQLGATLNTPTPHPNLLQIHDFEHSGELLVLEMEYAPGGSLTERIQRSREKGDLIPILEALTISMDVAAGLAPMHARDIVHRDLKPSNILFDNQKHAKVADLGLAQVPGGPSLRSQLSNPNPHPGTPAYMSPEQETTRTYLTPASDIYALGVVLFEMLSGRIYRNLRPGTHVIQLRPETPPWLDDLLVRMLAENYRERPWDGQETLDLLRAGQEDSRQQEAQRQAQAQAEAKIRLEAIALERQAEEAQARLEQEQHQQQVAAQAKALQEAEAKARVEAKQKADEKTRLAAEAQKKENLILELAPGVKMEFVRVPAGEFQMGSEDYPDEKPLHKVRLDEYLMGKYLVTNRQYQAFVKATGHGKPVHWKAGSIPSGKEEHPVIHVNWQDAIDFCEWASQVSGKKVRLPTEAEWEKAARGTDGRKYPWGNQAPDANRCNNYDSNVKDTTPVGKYSPTGDSPYGCVDMAGNVLEWVNDWYDANYYNQSPASNPSGPTSGRSRVLRGGSWNGDNVNVRTAFRGWNYPTLSGVGIGFRCVLSP